MRDADLIARLERIERKLDALLLDAGALPDVCPYCGSGDIHSSATMGEPYRRTCSGCGQSFTEAVSG